MVQILFCFIFVMDRLNCICIPEDKMPILPQFPYKVVALVHHFWTYNWQCMHAGLHMVLSPLSVKCQHNQIKSRKIFTPTGNEYIELTPEKNEKKKIHVPD